ncbi:MAG: hypothetical protein RBS84_05880 [Kiritimatiellia bacterium]|nr:hypothetical protein [Kiritimatiellia bacterium]
MKIYSWMILPLLTASLFLTGCGSDSDNNDEAPPAAPVVQSDAPPSANEQFAAITPSGLVLEDKFTIAGRGTVYTVRCTAIAGAVSYTFTTSFGASETVAVNTVGFQKTGADEAFTLSVYATNAKGINTRTASKKLN